jgi:mannan endo-1,4-beta-mannosidase
MVLSETGCEQIPVSNWWTNVLWPAIKDQHPAYVLLWRNGRPDHYYVPYQGHLSQDDFKDFQRNPRIFFQDEWKAVRRH